MTRRAGGGRTGAALIAALAATAAVAGLLAWMQARTLARLDSARGLRETERLRIAAAEIAREAAWAVAADRDLQVDHAGEDWARRRERAGDGFDAWAVAEDAGRWVDWNNLGAVRQPGRSFRDITRNLMACCGQFEADAFLAALADYTDEDGEGPYEEPFYRRSNLERGPPNRVLRSGGELAAVPGFRADWWAAKTDGRAADDLFGGDLRAGALAVPADREAPVPVNLNTAGREALLAVAGVEQDAPVRTAMAMRSLRPFETTGILFAAHPEVAAALQGALDVKSRFFRVRAEAKAEASGRTWRVAAWYERGDDGALRCLQWAEGGV